MANKIKVTVWNEYRHEKAEKEIAEKYPSGIHGVIKEILSECDDLEIRCATLDEPEHGLTDELVFSSWFEQGNIFRSGCTFYRGKGKIFYFQPGHESCDSFYNKHVRTIIKMQYIGSIPSTSRKI